MFYSARLKLTAWYLLIIMMISILFSVVIYSSINQELERFDRMQRERLQQEIFLNFPFPPQTEYDATVILEARRRVIVTLALINVGILVGAGVAGYFLAGRTLLPIQEMVDEQHRFISDASHELRTPLTALRSEIEVGLRDKRLSLREAKDLLTSNLEEVVSLQMLSDSLLQLTNSRSDRTIPTTVMINDSIQQAIKKVTPLAKKKKITITVTGNEEKVRGDHISLTQLFIILLENAIKYSHPNKGVKVTVKKADHSILLTVEDKGIGIGKDDLPYIFDRFYRADEARSKNNGGYGLGLSIAKKIVEVHHGEISIASTKQKGTTVRVKLPAVS